MFRLLSDQVKQFVKIPYSHVSLQALKAYWHMSGACLNMAGVAMASGFGTKSQGSVVERELQVLKPCKWR
jgi:hypothetical protein